jgi:SAM-dependent methyltransferase
MQSMLQSFTWPSEAFWRRFELAAVRRQHFGTPILELGCGDGSFTELAGLYVDEAIDLSPRAVAKARRRTAVYGNVRTMDMRELGDASETRFATIFANSVLEHVPDLQGVLQACTSLLVPGGTLITTVPLVNMNDHLVFRQDHYAEWRRRELRHHNLWGVDQWVTKLRRAGFASVTFTGYLDPRSCRFWDAIDIVGSFGVSRVRVGRICRQVLWPLLPRSVRRPIARAVSARLLNAFESADDVGAQPCAALLVATTPTTASAHDRGAPA